MSFEKKMDDSDSGVARYYPNEFGADLDADFNNVSENVKNLLGYTIDEPLNNSLANLIKNPYAKGAYYEDHDVLFQKQDGKKGYERNINDTTFGTCLEMEVLTTGYEDCSFLIPKTGVETEPTSIDGYKFGFYYKISSALSGQNIRTLSAGGGVYLNLVCDDNWNWLAYSDVIGIGGITALGTNWYVPFLVYNMNIGDKMQFTGFMLKHTTDPIVFEKSYYFETKQNNVVSNLIPDNTFQSDISNFIKDYITETGAQYRVDECLDLPGYTGNELKWLSNAWSSGQLEILNGEIGKSTGFYLKINSATSNSYEMGFTKNTSFASYRESRKNLDANTWYQILLPVSNISLYNFFLTNDGTIDSLSFANVCKTELAPLSFDFVEPSLNDFPLLGQKFGIMADSISDQTVWIRQAAEELGCILVNCGIGSTGIQNQGSFSSGTPLYVRNSTGKNISSITWGNIGLYDPSEYTGYYGDDCKMVSDLRVNMIDADTDLVTIMTCANDINFYNIQSGLSLIGAKEDIWNGTDDETTPSTTFTFYGVCRYLIDKIVDRAPSAKLVIVIEEKFWTEFYDNTTTPVYVGNPVSGMNAEAIRNIWRELAEYLGIYTIDFSKIIGNKIETCVYNATASVGYSPFGLIDDFTHPTNLGSSKMGDYYVSKIKQLFNL